MIQLSTPVPLAASDTSGRKWIHVATTGTFAGYRRGSRPFTFSRATFQTILANFRRHPQFRRGPVIAYDYEHASEQMHRIPSVAQHGVPATGWIYDLQVRDSAAGAQLWALTEWTSRAREQILAGEYRWTSVAVDPDFVDPISGENQGPTLTSVALTNKPFLQSLEPIAASLGGANDNGGDGLDAAVMRTVDEINRQQGRNELEKANNYLRTHIPSHRTLHPSEQIRVAGQFLRDLGGAPARVGTISRG